MGLVVCHFNYFIHHCLLYILFYLFLYYFRHHTVFILYVNYSHLYMDHESEINNYTSVVGGRVFQHGVTWTIRWSHLPPLRASALDISSGVILTPTSQGIKWEECLAALHGHNKCEFRISS